MNMNKTSYLLLTFLVLNCFGENVTDYQNLNYKFDEAKFSFKEEY